MKARVGLLIGVISVFALYVGGCAGKYTGGGWIPSAAPADQGRKANFGFNMHADDTNGDGYGDEYKGQLQWSDNGKNVTFHGVITYGERDYYWDYSNWGYIEGNYEPQPRRLGPGGRFYALVQDNGEPGSLEPGIDLIEIHCVSGYFAGYSNAGYLGGGNIQYHPPEEEDGS